MVTIRIPDTVAKALGPDASRDFVSWLEEVLKESSSQAGFPISALVARQKVNVLLLEHIGNLFLAGEPALMKLPDGNWVWRVPIDFTLPSYGRLGQAGALDVDAVYGEVRYSQNALAQIEAAAQELFQGVSSDRE